jgi:hypothetical protein
MPGPLPGNLPSTIAIGPMKEIPEHTAYVFQVTRDNLEHLWMPRQPFGDTYVFLVLTGSGSSFGALTLYSGDYVLEFKSLPGLPFIHPWYFGQTIRVPMEQFPQFRHLRRISHFEIRLQKGALNYGFLIG